jgi:hypothetical protein
MIKNALMVFGVSVGAYSALIFGVLTGCLLFLSSGAVAVRSSQGIILTPLVFNDGHLMSLNDFDGLKVDEISNDLTKNIVLMADKGADDLFSSLINSFSTALTNNSLELVPFILVRHIMDGSDPSSGFYP